METMSHHNKLQGQMFSNLFNCSPYYSYKHDPIFTIRIRKGGIPVEYFHSIKNII